MISRENDHCRIFAFPFDQRCSQSDTWCGISSARFGNDIFCREHQDFPCLNCRNFIGDHKHIFSIQQRKQPLNGIFQQSLLSIQRDQRFRAFVCTLRSQSFPFSANHNDGKNFLFCNIHFLILLIPCSNFVCGSKRHLILSLWGK